MALSVLAIFRRDESLRIGFFDFIRSDACLRFVSEAVTLAIALLIIELHISEQ